MGASLRELLQSYVAVIYLHAYFAELSDASMCGLPSMLAIHSILFEEQVYFVVLWVVALRNEMNGHKPGVCNTNRHTDTSEIIQNQLMSVFHLFWSVMT